MLHESKPEGYGASNAVGASMGSTSKAKRWIWPGWFVLVLSSCAGVPVKRPSKVSSDAVFIPAPAPQRGEWLTCQFDEGPGVNRCRLSKPDGSLEYEGSFLRYEASGAVPARGGRIDVAAAGASIQWRRFGKRLLPTIHLPDGTTLLPAEAYGDDPLHEDE